MGDGTFLEKEKIRVYIIISKNNGVSVFRFFEKFTELSLLSVSEDKELN